MRVSDDQLTDVNMLIHYSDGKVGQGILLSLRGNRMRVAIKDGDDVAEFRFVAGVWISEECEPVTFEFPTAIWEAIGIVPERPKIEPEAKPMLVWVRESARATGSGNN